MREHARGFLRRHWAAERAPEIYCDPRALLRDLAARASLHAKCVVADRALALITSANLTDAARQRNIEVGVLLRGGPEIARLGAHFAGLIADGILKSCTP